MNRFELIVQLTCNCSGNFCYLIFLFKQTDAVSLIIYFTDNVLCVNILKDSCSRFIRNVGTKVGSFNLF